MLKNKSNGEVKSQLHLYCNSKLYDEFKQAVKQYNKDGNTDTTISELIRDFMADFIRQHNKGGV